MKPVKIGKTYITAASFLDDVVYPDHVETLEGLANWYEEESEEYKDSADKILVLSGTAASVTKEEIGKFHQLMNQSLEFLHRSELLRDKLKVMVN